MFNFICVTLNKTQNLFTMYLICTEKKDIQKIFSRGPSTPDVNQRKNIFIKYHRNISAVKKNLSVKDKLRLNNLQSTNEKSTI